MNFKKILYDAKNLTANAIDKVQKVKDSAEQKASEFWDENGEQIKEKTTQITDKSSEIVKEVADTTVTTIKTAATSTKESTENIIYGIVYSDTELKNIQQRVENQGGMYRELNRNSTTFDSIMIGGETLAVLLAATHIPDEILQAYQAAYPNLSEEISFAEKVQQLDGDSLIGLISGVKGKLFEMKYVDYLNDGNLPEGYEAVLAVSAIQPGWDIAINGPHEEIADIIQAKATDSISYVKDAIEKYPGIDIVTTDEVYSYLVMSGISEGIINSGISNTELIDQIQDGVDATELTMDFTPPLFTLAFIAFTSYSESNLSLYERAKNVGDRAGKTYLSYLVGTGLAVITNTWWLGVVGSVGSRMLSDQGKRKYEIYEQLKKVESNNQRIIDRLKDKQSHFEALPF